jgi:uncharacterized protein (TIGR00159 family)
VLAILKAWLEKGILHWLDWILVVIGVGVVLFLSRRSRVAIPLRGFLLLLCLYLITGSLPTVHLLLDKVLVGAAVVLGVVFQLEFRDLLEWVGRGGNQKPNPTLESEKGGDDYLEELVQAVRDLSQNRTGALMVLELEKPIDPRIFTDEGVTLSAQLSRELIQTIFQPSTLLHDGAVLIQGNQVKAAGVILPVSDRVASRQLGTRHRAAMGISEQANCLCIVVSEETGSISLAQAGRLERPITSSKLRELLTERLQPPLTKQSELPLRTVWIQQKAKQWLQTIKSFLPHSSVSKE